MTAWSRRDFIAAVLGAPLAAACRGPGPALPAGELYTPGKAAGHRRLRDPGPGGDVRKPDVWRQAEVVVVGGGASGLAAAWQLGRRGVADVAVVELDDVVGGTAQAGAGDGFEYPWGAHYIVAPQAHQRHLIDLLGELGGLDGVDADGAPVVAEVLRCRAPEERLFYRGRWYDGLYPGAGADAEARAQLAAFERAVDGWVGWRDDAGRRAFTLPTSAATTAAEVTALDGLSMAAWLDARGLTSPRLRWWVDYACRDDYGLLAADTSAWAGLAYFAARRARPGAEAQPVVTWPGGNGALIAHLAGQLGDRVTPGVAVTRVAAVDGGVEVVGYHGERAVGWRARRAILAIPLHVARHVAPALGARAMPAVDRGAWAVANLHLTTRPRERIGDAPPAWDNVLHDSASLGYVVATHQTGRTTAGVAQGRDRGPTVFTWYYPFTGPAADARRDLDGAGRDEWAAAALADLTRAHPDLPGRVRRVDVTYWGHGMPRPRPGAVFDPALAALRAPLGPIHLAGTDLSGLALFEEALDHGVRAADEVVAALAVPA
ncbi:MAG: FAD-dependent oxidoreductase [Kofleriaceae bacterium]